MIINDFKIYPKENDSIVAIGCSDGNCLIWNHVTRKIIVVLIDPYE